MSRARVDRAALLTGARSKVATPTANPLLPRGPEPQSPAALAMTLPVPRETLPDGSVLMEDERRDLAACELAVDYLRVAFWAAGKALQVIRDGRLYRETHETFEVYVSKRWDMSRAQAYRLIEAWPLAEQLRMSPIGDTLNESHVRALLPVVRCHGEEAALEVVAAVKQETGKVTAAAIKATAGRLGYVPHPAPSPAAEDDQGQSALALLEQGLATLRKAHRELRGSVLADAIADDPDRARELAAEMAKLAARIARIAEKGMH